MGPFIFSFSVGGLISFAFQFGARPCSCQDAQNRQQESAKQAHAPNSSSKNPGTSHRKVRKASQNMTDALAPAVLGTKAVHKASVHLDDVPCSGSLSGTNTASRSQTAIKKKSSMGYFSRLPSEIRLQIYEELLKTDKLISGAHILVSTREAIMEHECPRIGIHCGILYTCRELYNEALPTLYGKNGFLFYDPAHLKTFAHSGLPTRSLTSRFGFEDTKYGRLTLIRKLGLNIGKTANYEHHLPLDRKHLWDKWDSLFDRDHSINALGFPTLKSLTLNFSHWQLGVTDEHEIRQEVIRAIVEKLRDSGGLSCLWVIGMRQEQNLFDLKQGLVKAGGTFKVGEERDSKVVDVTEELGHRLHQGKG